VLGRPLALAIGEEGTWTTRTPVLVARADRTAGITPTVELNVPVVDGGVDRAVAGCFCRSSRAEYVLAHRGNSLTVTPWKIPKRIVHRYLVKWLATATDGDRQTPPIPAAPTGPDFIAQVARFADAVQDLKERWADAGGAEDRVKLRAAWRESRTFATTIAKAVLASTVEFEYRHGPLQESLQEALRERLQRPFSIALNQHVDLAILRGDAVRAIIEVKIDLGPADAPNRMRHLRFGVGEPYVPPTAPTVTC
jgi:hypothetical protein